MPEIVIPIASHFLTGSILTLALPLGVFIAIAIWYVCCGVAARVNGDEPSVSLGTGGKGPLARRLLSSQLGYVVDDLAGFEGGRIYGPHLAAGSDSVDQRGVGHELRLAGLSG